MTQETANQHTPEKSTLQGGIRTSSREASSISLKGLSKRFSEDVVALDHVDLDIRAGEFFTLLGPSGCGKTTLLRMLAGFESADEGVVMIGGRDVTDIPPHKRSVNTVFQSYALFPHLSVHDNIAFGLKMRGINTTERDERVKRMAATLKIDALLERHIHQLSGGQRQRIALARALVNEPDVLLLDEPLSALDAGLRSDLQVELKRLQQNLGMTFVFVTHDQEEAMVMSDRIALLNSGKIQQVGTPPEVYERPVNRFVAKFIGHDNLYPVSGRDGMTVTTPLGKLTTEFSNEGKLALLRPEIIELTQVGSAGVDPKLALNRLVGRVEERFYRGATVEYRLSCDGVPLLAEATNSGDRLFRVGDDVQVEIYPEDVVLIDDEP